MLVEGTFVGRVAAGMCDKILVSQGFKTPFDVAGDDAPGPDGLLFSCQARDTENECTFRFRRTKPSAWPLFRSLRSLIRLRHWPSTGSVGLHGGCSTSPWFM